MKYELKIDAKGRVTLPKEVRKGLGNDIRLDWDDKFKKGTLFGNQDELIVIRVKMQYGNVWQLAAAAWDFDVAVKPTTENDIMLAGKVKDIKAFCKGKVVEEISSNG